MKHKFPTWGSNLSLLLGCLLTSLVSADEPPVPADSQLRFVRLSRNADDTPQSLDTAVMRYRDSSRSDGLLVDLVGAVHVGDQGYYELLNRLFTQYDVVLYELVAPEGTRIPKGGRPEESGNPISMMQNMTKSMLGLASQLDHVDYTQENFVHADMSPEDMVAAMKSRGDNAFSFALRAMADVIRQANKQVAEMDPQDELNIEQEFISLLTDDNAAAKLKLMMAKQFDQLGGTEMALGATFNQALVKDRNAAAINVFQRQLAQGRKRIAIFYGAAHMADFDRRLREDFGLQRVDTQWLKAWDLTVPVQQSSPLNAFLRLLNG